MLLTIAAFLAQNTSPAAVQLILAVLCVVVLSSVAVGVSIGLARRMNEIAERTPRKNPPHPPATSNDDQLSN